MKLKIFEADKLIGDAEVYALDPSIQRVHIWGLRVLRSTVERCGDDVAARRAQQSRLNDLGASIMVLKLVGSLHGRDAPP